VTLSIDRSDYDELRRHAEKSYPREACGVLLGDCAGTARSVRSVVQCSNACIESPQNRYRIEPAELLRVQRRAREAGQSILGFYHSHPDRPAYWSATDLEEAHWSGCSYLIIAVDSGRVGAARSFVLVDDGDAKHFEHEDIELY